MHPLGRRCCSFLIPLAMLLPLSACSSLEATSSRTTSVRAANTEAARDDSLFRAYAEKYPSDVGIILSQAKSLAAAGSRDAADALLRKLDSSEQDVRVLVWRASLEPDPAAKERLARRAIALDYRSGLAHYHLGNALAAKGNWADARQEYILVTLFDRTQFGGWWSLAVSEIQLGQLSDSVSSVVTASNRAWNFERGDPAWAYLALAEIYKTVPSATQAVSRWKAEASRKPKDQFEPILPVVPAQASTQGLPIPWDEAPALGIIFESDPAGQVLSVARVLRHSIADNAGVHVGDVLKAINGVDCSSIKDVIAQTSGSTVPTRWCLRVARSGTEADCCGELVTGSDISKKFEQLIAAGRAAESSGKTVLAADTYSEAIDTIGDYNGSLVARWSVVSTLAGRFEGVNRFLNLWLATSQHDDTVLFLLANVHSIAARTPPPGESWASMRKKAREYIDQAILEAPDSGFYEAFRGLVCDAPAESINYWGSLEESDRSKSLERSIALGHGGWAQRDLAKWLDSTETALRSAEKQRREEAWRGFALGLGVGAMAGLGSSSSGGGNYWSQQSTGWNNYTNTFGISP